MYIENINSPKDLKGLSIEQLKVVADEVRKGVLNRVSNHGGHVGPNLGITEATVALHYVFNAPEDKFIFDVSHQSYPHKMLTGRKDGFLDATAMDHISGYSSPLESPIYDNFEVGHTSTSVALATGMQKARDIMGGKENIIAIIGDGSLSGGEAFEGLDTAAELGTNVIIVVNDNEMSIAENHGGIYKNLKLLRDTKGQAELNYFKAFGFDYLYVEEGNNVEKLIEAFQKVKDIDHPIVVHIHTEKGYGYKPAMKDKEEWHWNLPFDLATGKSKVEFSGEDYSSLIGEFLLAEMKKDPKLVAIASAVPAAAGFDKALRKEAGKQFIDVGIAEEEAVALASGMAKRGAHPVYTTYATFLQRTYDQLSQDLAVNGNPALINVMGASIFGMNDFTHICFFDIPLFSHIPNIVYLAPTTYEEFIAMEKWGIRQDKYSVAIRVPANGVVHSNEEYESDYSDLNKYKMAHRGKDVALIALGDFYQKGEEVAKSLAQNGIDATLINPRYISGTDDSMLESLKKDHHLIVTLEDGSLDGGFGERIARFYGPSDMKVMTFGVRKQLYDRYDVEQLMRDNHLTNRQIVNDIMNIIK
ncbi:MAG: 1-deoxy-D-xylulose-5-phosphate synthase [Prevotella sp.]|jgi:1-deoxy-D-xylulose-5-phosphate synthase|nr:1-deoxy-D-xylulose-5-phosphate synthase [Prevotella sp.]MCI1282646.1 1-deoxy-D-xylulose-5-phosphate synthase [Prevotella sp.]